MTQLPNEASVIYVGTSGGVYRCPTATRDSCATVATSKKGSIAAIAPVASATGACAAGSLGVRRESSGHVHVQPSHTAMLLGLLVLTCRISAAASTLYVGYGQTYCYEYNCVESSWVSWAETDRCVCNSSCCCCACCCGCC